MVCRSFKIGNVTGFVCSRGEKAPRCSECGKPATKLCDFPIIGKPGKKTCDKKLCDRCSTEIDPARLPIRFLEAIEEKPDVIDVCPVHLRFIEKKENGDD